MMNTFSWTVLVGGFAFFFFGLISVRKSLQMVAGKRLRGALGHVASNRIIAFAFGAFMTLILQSSGATSTMLVSFAETELLTLTQAIAVLLGADVGTTLTLGLMAIRSITIYALIIVAIGFFIQIAARGKNLKNLGSIVFGFGLVFYGLNLMTQAALPLKQTAMAMQIFDYLAVNPFVMLVLTVILASAIHSVAMIGIAIALAFSGVITFEMAVPIVLGANIGTCVTTIVASLGSGTRGRRVAMAQTLSKLVGVAVVFPFIPQLAGLVSRLDLFIASVIPTFATTVAAKIVILHILFNLCLGLIFLPFIGVLQWITVHMIPKPLEKEERFGPKYLDKSSLETPSLAFAQVKREIMRTAEIAHSMFERCLRMFSRGTDSQIEIENIQEDEDKVDILEKAVRFYLAEVAQERCSAEQVKIQMSLLSITADLEDIGDTISKEMASLARKKSRWHRLFSDAGWMDLRGFQKAVLENFSLIITMLAQPSEEVYRTLVRHEDHMNRMEQDYRQAHLNRLHQGLQESFDTSSIHLDILSNIRRVNAKLTHIGMMIAQCQTDWRSDVELS